MFTETIGSQTKVYYFRFKGNSFNLICEYSQTCDWPNYYYSGNRYYPVDTDFEYGFWGKWEYYSGTATPSVTFVKYVNDSKTTIPDTNMKNYFAGITIKSGTYVNETTFILLSCQ